MLEAIEEILMMLPPFCLIIFGMIDLIIKYIDLMFTLNEKSQSFSSHSSIVPWWTKPTALNNTSTLSKDFVKFSISDLFVESSFNALKPNGFLVYITPDNWLKGDSKKIRRATQFLYNQQVTYLNLDTSNYFPTIGESICSYIVENKKKQYPTPIIYKGANHTELIEGPLDLLVDKKVKNLNDKIINKF